MKPLNSEERTKQFFIFLAFFVAAMALVIVTVYFNAIYNPKHHNEVLRKENKEIKKQLEINGNYLSSIDSLYSELRKMKDMKSAEVGRKLPEVRIMNANFSNLITKDENQNPLLSKYKAVFDLSLDILGDDQELKKSKEEGDKTKQELKDTKDEFKEYKDKHPF